MTFHRSCDSTLLRPLNKRIKIDHDTSAISYPRNYQLSLNKGVPIPDLSLSKFRPAKNIKSKPIFFPVDQNIKKIICSEFLSSELAKFAHKNTSHGRVYYSPRYNDSRYQYRHVILSPAMADLAHQVSLVCKSKLLTEEQIVHGLGIDLSPGWEHFMLFKDAYDELILRRPLPHQDSFKGYVDKDDEIPRDIFDEICIDSHVDSIFSDICDDISLRNTNSLASFACSLTSRCQRPKLSSNSTCLCNDHNNCDNKFTLDAIDSQSTASESLEDSLTSSSQTSIS